MWFVVPLLAVRSGSNLSSPTLSIAGDKVDILPWC